MLFNITTESSVLVPKRVLPNLYKLGSMIVQYDNYYKIDGESLVGKNHCIKLNSIGELEIYQEGYPTFQLWRNNNVVSNFKKPDTVLDHLNPRSICTWDKHGNLHTSIPKDIFTPPVTGDDISCDKAATEILKILRRNLHAIAAESPGADLYFSGGYDTGVLAAISLADKLPFSVKERDKGYTRIGDHHRASTSPAQRYLRKSHSDFAHLPPWSERLVTGFYGGMTTLRWTPLGKHVLKAKGLDYEELYAQTYYKNSYMGEFLESPEGISWRTIESYDGSIDIKEHCDNLLMHLAETWSIDGIEVFTPYRDRNIHWWISALSKYELAEHLFHQKVYKKMILQANPDFLGKISLTKS